MTQSLTMSTLYKRLSRIGLKKDYVQKNGLPSWWNDELDDKPVAVLEGAGYIAKNLNLDISSLLNPGENIKFNPIVKTKFKQHKKQDKSHPYLAQALASRIAELIAYGTNLQYTTLPDNAQSIREEILSKPKQKKVNLKSLLDYCWGKGIAVGYFQQFPEKTKKFTGLIQWYSNSPIIILSSNSKHSAKLAFDLAHELGHLVLGHLKSGVLVDEKIELDCQDEEELQANNFANKLLMGNSDNCLGNKKFHSHNYLLKHAKIRLEKNPPVDIASIILNYAWHNSDNWGFAIKALSKLEPNIDCQKIINEHLAQQLDWDKYNDETYEYLEKVLKV